MDSDFAKANAVPIIGYAVGGEIVGQYIYDGFNQATLVGKFNKDLRQQAQTFNKDLRQQAWWFNKTLSQKA